MKCKMEKKINAYLDKELSIDNFKQVQSHLSICSICQQTLRELMQVNKILSNFQEENVPQPLLHAILEKTETQSHSSSYKRAYNFGIAAAVIFSFFSGLWFSNKVFSQTSDNETVYELGSESLFSLMLWEE